MNYVPIVGIPHYKMMKKYTTTQKAVKVQSYSELYQEVQGIQKELWKTILMKINRHIQLIKGEIEKRKIDLSSVTSTDSVRNIQKDILGIEKN